jgi:hypothetical protein
MINGRFSLGWRAHWLALCLCLVCAAPTRAAEFEFAGGDGKAVWNTRAVIGAAIRTTSPSRHLVGKGYRSDGLPKGGDGGDSSDDGNLNFGNGDPYSGLFKISSGLDVKYRNVGFSVSGRAWYDAVLKDRDVPQGNTGNGFVPNTPLSDRGFSRSNKFSGVMLLDAYVYGNAKAGEHARWDVRVGKQRVKWGEGLFFNGINQVNPSDLTTLRRPGTDPASESQVPVEMVWNRLTFDNGFSVEGFYQWKWRSSELDPCGTFFAASDIGVDPGCAGTQANTLFQINVDSPDAGPWLSDGYLNSVGAVLPRGGRDIRPSDQGQFGLALHYQSAPLNTDLGVYWMRYHARTPIFDVTLPNSALLQPDLLTRMLDDGVTEQYARMAQSLATITEFWEYPDGIHLMGLSAATKWRQWRFSGELSRTDDLPVQLSSGDMFVAATRNEGPMGDRTRDQPEGFLLHGYDRFHKLQLQLGASRVLGPALGAENGALTAEMAYQHVNLPPMSVNRYGRGFAWGYSSEGFGGGCSPVANPDGCVNGGFYTRSALGYRVRYQLNYSAQGATLSPSLTWSHDVSGYSVDNQLVEHRRIVVAGLTAKFPGGYFASAAYTRYLGENKYDILADHDNLVLALGATF